MAKKKKPTWLLFTMMLCVTIPVLALLKTTVFSNNKNILASDNSTKYDIVVDLGEGGRFESGEFSKMPDGKWIHKYLPSKNPITLPKPVKDGYIFDGWLTPGDQPPKPEFIIPAWHKGNINLTTKWRTAESDLIDGKSFASTVRSLPNFSNATEIRFVRQTPKSDGVDLSLEKNGSIRGWQEGNIFYVASDGKIYANSNSEGLFKFMDNLNAIKFENFDTSKVTTMRDMFKYCKNLVTLDLSPFDTSKVTNTYMMFAECEKLSNLNLGTFNTSNVTNMDSMFRNCKVLTNLNLSSFDTSKVTEISSLFIGCNKLETIDISNFKLNSITDLSWMFYKCHELTNIVGLQNIFTSNVVKTSYMFGECSKLSGELIISNPNITEYTDMFKGCSSGANVEFWVDYKDAQTKVVAQNMVNTKNSGDHVYLKIPSSTLVDGRTFNHAVKSMPNYNGIFHIIFEKGLPQNATSYEHIDVSLNQDKSIIAYKVGDTLHVGCEGVIYANENCRQMFRSYIMPDDPPGTPGGTGFLKLKSLKLNNFNTSKTQDMSYMFSGLTKITSLDVSMLDTSNVTDMSGMFDGCKSLASLDVSNFDTSKVVSMGSMFSELPITSINLKNFNTENVTSMLGMFRGCTNLQTLDLTNFNTKKVTSLTYFVENCENLVDLNLSSFDFSNVTNFWATFYRCLKLKDIHTVIPVRNDAKCMYTFRDCNSLNLTLIIDCSGITKYEEMLLNCSTESGTRAVVNYTNAASKRMAQTLVNTRSSNSNVVLGRQVTVPVGKAKVRTISSKPNTLTLDNGPSAQFPKQVINISNNKIPNLPSPTLNPQYAGQFGGYYYDRQYTKPVKAGDIITKDLTIYARW